MNENTKDQRRTSQDRLAEQSRVIMGGVYSIVSIVIFALVCYAVLKIVSSPSMETMCNSALVIIFTVIDWFGENWFQALIVLFMLRVWVGLSALTGFAERLCMTICNDDVALLLRNFSEARRTRPTT